MKGLDLALMATVALLILVFVAWPFASVFLEGLHNQGGKESVSFFSMVRDARGLLEHSLVVALLTTGLTTFFALCLTFSFFFANKLIRQIIHSLLTLGMISPPFVASLAYLSLFGRRGLITYRLFHLSWNPYGLKGIVLMQSFSFIPLAAMVLLAQLTNIDASLLDSARSLGAKTWELIRDVLFPQLRGSLLVVLMLTLIRSLADFTTPTIIGGAYGVLSTEAYLAFIAEGNLPRAMVLNLILLVPALLAMLVYLRAYRRVQTVTHGLASPQTSGVLWGRGFAIQASRLVAGAYLLALLLQYGTILLMACGRWQGGVYGLTWANWADSVNHLGTSFLRSLGYSFVTAAAATLIGFLLAYYLHIRQIRGFKLLDSLATLPYIIPGSFFGIAYILAFRSPPLALTGTAAIVLLNMTFKQVPLAAKLGASALGNIDAGQIDSVQDLGGHPLLALRDVLLPQSRPSLLLAFFRSFTSGMTTIGSIIFLVYPQRKLATLVLFDVVQSGKYGVASVIAVLLTLVCWGMEYLGRKVGKVGKVS